MVDLKAVVKSKMNTSCTRLKGLNDFAAIPLLALEWILWNKLLAMLMYLGVNLKTEFLLNRSELRGRDGVGGSTQEKPETNLLYNFNYLLTFMVI